MPLTSLRNSYRSSRTDEWRDLVGQPLALAGGVRAGRPEVQGSEADGEERPQLLGAPVGRAAHDVRPGVLPFVDPDAQVVGVGQPGGVASGLLRRPANAVDHG